MITCECVVIQCKQSTCYNIGICDVCPVSNMSLWLPERGAYGAAGPALTRSGRSRDALLDARWRLRGGRELSATHDPHARRTCTLHSPSSTNALRFSRSSTILSARHTFELFAASALAYKYEVRWRGPEQRRTPAHRESTSA